MKKPLVVITQIFLSGFAETITGEGYTWAALKEGGSVLWIRRKNGNKVLVMAR